MMVKFSSKSWNDYINWQQQDKKILKRINQLIKDIQRNGAADGIGKPEALKHNFSGWFSRRINVEHRLIYRVTEERAIEIASCKYHYD
ncbi:MAG: Txe/YoeB family addiction module toxin [Micrococcaceae bacterium]